MRATTIDTGRLTMGYELVGPEAAPVVCLNHCFAADHRYWDPHLPAFSNFRVLRFDIRGHGLSDATPGPYDLTMLAADVASLLDALHIDKVHYCGVSLGGQIAQTFALEHPDRVRSLTIVNSTCEYTDAQTRAWRDRADVASTQGMEALRAPLLERWFTPEAAANRIPGYQYMDAAIGRFSAESFAAASHAMCMLDTTGRLPDIHVPTMIVATPDDPGAPREVSEKMARLVPDCRLHWLEPAHHLSSLEHPERFNALMEDFLGKLN